MINENNDQTTNITVIVRIENRAKDLVLFSRSIIRSVKRRPTDRVIKIETVIVVLLNNSTARIENLTLASWLRSALTVFEVIGMSLLVGTILF